MNKENPMSATPKSLAHVVYRTHRFAEMLGWYHTVFGAKVQYQNPAMAVPLKIFACVR